MNRRKIQVKRNIKILLAVLLLAAQSAPLGYAAGNAAASRAENLKRLDVAAAADKSENREALEALGHTLWKDIEGLEIDSDLLKAARDKNLDWKTRFLLLELVERAGKKKITRDEELGLYSDALSDNGEHNEVRKRAAQALMEPSRTEPKARKALEKAAKDKAMPADVLWSVMVSAGSSGMDDVDTLAELMKRPAKTNNEIGINLNAVRALGQSKDPRAIGMLFKILDESGPDSFFNVTALEQFSWLIKDPEKEKKLRPMLAPRLIKLLDDRGSHIGASRNLSGRILVRMNEKKAIPHIIKWLKPKNEGGGYNGDVLWGAEILAEFQAKEAIPELQKIVDNFSSDPRWAEAKRLSVKQGFKFPEETHQYPTLRECLKKLKGEKYDKSKVMLPWDY